MKKKIEQNAIFKEREETSLKLIILKDERIISPSLKTAGHYKSYLYWCRHAIRQIYILLNHSPEVFTSDTSCHRKSGATTLSIMTISITMNEMRHSA